MLPSRSAMQVTPFSRNSAQAARTESTWSSTVKLSWPGIGIARRPEFARLVLGHAEIEGGRGMGVDVDQAGRDQRLAAVDQRVARPRQAARRAEGRDGIAFDPDVGRRQEFVGGVDREDGAAGENDRHVRSCSVALGRRGRRGQKIGERAQPLADVIDHQPGGRRQAAIARHQDADAALRQARLGQRHVHQLAAADLLDEADRREEADAQPRADHLAHELDGVGDDARRQARARARRIPSP